MNGLFVFGFLLMLFGSCLSQLDNRERNFLIFTLYYHGIDVPTITNCTDPVDVLPLRCIQNRLFASPPFEEDPRHFGLRSLGEAVRLIQEFLQSADTVANNSEVNVDIDFTQCGVYPACAVRPLSTNLWSFTCDRPILTFIAAIGVMLSALVIICNILIIAVTLTTKSLRKPHSYFKLSLAFADLVAGVFVIPSIVHNSLNTIDFNKFAYNSFEMLNFTNYVEDNSAEATFFGIMGVLSTITAVLSLLCLSVDSFLAVKSPLRYRIGDLINKKKAFFMVIGIWLFSLLLALLPLITNSVFTYGLSAFTFQYIPLMTPVQNTTYMDSALKRFPNAFAYAILVWGVPFVITWILTVMTSLQSRKMLKHMREARKRSIRSEKALDKVDRDLVRTVAIVLTLFTVTILPVFGVGIAVVFSNSIFCYSQGTVLAFFFTTYVLICGRFLNVIVYNVFNKEFRTACHAFLRRIIAFLCCVDQYEATLLPNSSNGKKITGILSTSKRKSSDAKSQTKETEITSRHGSRSISISTDIQPSSPTSPKTHNGALYANATFTINEAEEP